MTKCSQNRQLHENINDKSRQPYRERRVTKCCKNNEDDESRQLYVQRERESVSEMDLKDQESNCSGSNYSLLMN